MHQQLLVYQLKSLLNEWITYTQDLLLKLHNLQNEYNNPLRNIETEPKNITKNEDHSHGYEVQGFGDICDNDPPQDQVVSERHIIKCHIPLTELSEVAPVINVPDESERIHVQRQ